MIGGGGKHVIGGGGKHACDRRWREACDRRWREACDRRWMKVMEEKYTCKSRYLCMRTTEISAKYNKYNAWRHIFVQGMLAIHNGGLLKRTNIHLHDLRL